MRMQDAYYERIMHVLRVNLMLCLLKAQRVMYKTCIAYRSSLFKLTRKVYMVAFGAISLNLHFSMCTCLFLTIYA